MISDVFMEQLRSANPLEEVAKYYVNLKRRGRTFVCNCPFHSEKTPSCTIFPDTQSFYCFGCGAGGDVITFVRQIENLDFMETVKLLAQKSGLSLPKQDTAEERQEQLRKRILAMNREAANFYYRMLTGTDKRGLQYFFQRQLTPATIKKYGLGFAPDAWHSLGDFLKSKGYTEQELLTADLVHRSRNGGIYDTFRNRVIFPIVDVRGNVIGFGGRVLDDSQPKYLNTAQTPVFDKGKNLFSLQFAKNNMTSRIILAEGYMDVIAMHQAGFENTVATLGTAITADQARKISRYAKEVIIAYDSDAAGQNATQKALRHFGDVGVQTKILRMTGAKDPDEYIKKFGKERFRMLLDGSEDAVNFRLETCEQGLDLQLESDRATFLNRAAEVLVQLPDPVSRAVYLSRTAERCRIPAHALELKVEGMLRNQKRVAKKKQWSNVVQNTISAQKTAVSLQAASGSVRAEERILCYLLSYPEDARRVMESLQAADFSVPLYQNLFAWIAAHTAAQQECSLSALSAEFSNADMGIISRILNLRQECPPTPQEVTDCIRRLRNATPAVCDTDEALLQLVAEKSKKQSFS